ncbi:amino acid ABC transporter permease [Serratia ficaria]|uniref:amino acid ABC transporter permease n=1 Tax=Serratia ficaria TaxID=61651 RepID=UPI00217CBC26|nr:amino acid ABC transporter permease [Serratia ficaria]CAI0824455.1 L-cystine transport system permease protein tcyB [Serratia ficaria]CAI1506567.1 L-cystine transport system permease protein tcyB [Serratia ficaria]CAI1688978.1 L-cystine transport system permease protein tcyB [Serratia ficaria]
MDWQAILTSLPSLGDGMLSTLGLCALAAICSLIWGTLMAVAQMRAPPFWQRLLHLYSSLTLALPLLVVIYLLYFVLPEYDITFTSPQVGVLALTLYYAPYIAQVMRSAIETLPRGQWEACRVLGLSRREQLLDVVLPQTLPQMLSPLVGLMIGLIKDSALLSIVSVQEFMYAAKQAISDTYAPLEIYLTVALCYWALNSLIDWLARRIEFRMTGYRRGIRR